MEKDCTDSAGDSPPQITLRVFVGIFAVFCGSRLLILLIAQIAGLALIKDRFYNPANSFVELFTNWDANWYAALARDGYAYPGDGHSNVVFYPLYPLLVRVVYKLGMDVRVACYFVSNLALFGACFQMWKLAMLEWKSEAIANRAVLLLLLCPGSFWFSLGYAESIFVLLQILCLYLCRRKDWLGAGLAGYGLALTRTPGLLAGVFLAVEALAEWRERRSPMAAGRSLAPIAWWTRGVAVLAPILGHLSYMAYLRFQFGDWMAQHKALAAGWQDTGVRNPWRHFLEQRGMDEPYEQWICYPMLFVGIILCIVIGPATRRGSYSALSAAFLALYLTTTNYSHFPRYLAVIVPFFLAAAWLGETSPLLETSFLVVSVALLALLTAFQVSGYWVY